jgi:Asp-tRNA(Asn)/Glu-tRNA(Gln) amidotransferase A subunit family amidase
MFADRRDGFIEGSSNPRVFLEERLERIAAREPDVKAFVHLDLDAARAAADASSERYRDGRPLSAIDGMPLGIKDVFDTRDLPTEMGSPFHLGRRAEHDAAHVYAARAAGAFVLGKTVTSMFAIVGAGPTRNPLDLSRSPGATSAGSAAAAAAGMVPVATGSQARGSILRPASYCGVYGFKPTYGALNRAGTLTPGKSYDHLGALAQSLDDLWLLLWEVAQRAGGDPGYPGLFGQAEPPSPRPPARIALIETAGWSEATDEARAALLSYADDLRSRGVRVTTRADDEDLARYEDLLQQVTGHWETISHYETLWPMQSYRDRDPTKLSAPILRGIENGERITPAAYRASLTWREALRRAHAELSGRFDLLATLSATGAAPTFPQPGSSTFNELATLIGVPALSAPLLAAEGLPLGLQLIGFRDRDYALLEYARSLQPVAP